MDAQGFPERQGTRQERVQFTPEDSESLPIQPTSELALAPVNAPQLIQPSVSIADAATAYQQMVAFVQRILRPGVDYGKIPGIDKPVLLLPGSEKIRTFFGLRTVNRQLSAIEDWTGADHGGEAFFAYTYRCELYRNGELIGSADGHCNSWEEKYRMRWVAKAEVPASVDLTKLAVKGGRVTELDFAIKGKETSGQYGKPLAYWENWEQAIADGRAIVGKPRMSKTGKTLAIWEMDGTVYGLPNQRVFDQVNTFIMIAQKRGEIKATRMSTGASEFFGQDLAVVARDLEGVVEGEYRVVDPEDEHGTGTGGVETPAQGAERLKQELLPAFKTTAAIVAAFKALDLRYTPEQHDQIRDQLLHYYLNQ